MTKPDSLPHYRAIALEKIGRLTQEKRAYLWDFYPHDDLFDFSESYLAKNELYDVIEKNYDLKTIYQYSLDSGIARNINYTTPEGALLPQAKGIPILRRSPFTRLVVDQIINPGTGEIRKTYNGKKIRFLMLDIKNLRNADFAIDQSDEHNKAADWMLNRVSDVIAQVVQDKRIPVNLDLRKFYCRYGGDEFAIAFVGDYEDEVVEMVKERLYAEIPTIEGYYADRPGGPRTKGNVALRNNEITTINVPENNIDQHIFVSFLRRGVIFEQEQIDSIKRKFTRQGDLDYDKLMIYLDDQTRRRRIYPESAVTIEDQIEYQKRAHPELTYYIELAQDLDSLEKEFFNRSESVTVRQERVLQYIEEVMYDQLLQENVYTRVDFQEYLKNGEFSQTICFDLKFIKEINSNLSYADGDEAIITLWDRIKAAINPKELEGIMIARYGGTIILGVRQGTVLSEETLQKLIKIQSIQISGESEHKTEIPIGNSYVSITNKRGLLVKDKAQALIDYSLDEAEKDWFGNIIRLIRTNSSVLNAVNHLMDSQKPAEFANDSIESLLYDFFTKKRKKERCGKMINVLQSPLFKIDDGLIELFSALNESPEIDS